MIFFKYKYSELASIRFSVVSSLASAFLRRRMDKVVLVTGAGSGIGAEIARHFARLGAKLSMVDLNAKNLNAVSDEITKAGFVKPLTIVADVTKDAQRIINGTVDHFGQLDVLVNNAGIVQPDSVVDFDVAVFDRIMNVNLRSVMVLTSLAVKHLEKTAGNIVNISSVAGVLVVDDFISYSISKAAVAQFTKCAATSLASKKIRVNAIVPGVIKTPILASLGVNETNFDQFDENYMKKCLVGRYGEVSDISEAAVYLASQSFVNGSLLVVDGGVICGASKGKKTFQPES